MGGRASHSSVGSNPTVSDRGDVKSDSYRYLRTTFDRKNNNKEKIYETGVAVLNHCFDDIEKFCARMQHVAVAVQELEARRRLTNSKRKPNRSDDSLLRLRATPPPEVEFIDILQKFKLALNLIAKLKYRLREPNAAQLVHYLLAPLTLLFNISKDKYYSPTMSNRAAAPLLTREALELVYKCLTPEQMDMWQSLGNAWTKCREDWKGYVAPFYPIFYDGWAPDFPNIVTSTPISPIKRQKEITDSL